MVGNDNDGENRELQQTFHDFEKSNEPKIQAFQYRIKRGEGARGRGDRGPPGPVKISHKEDGRQKGAQRFHVSRPVAGSATVFCR